MCCQAKRDDVEYTLSFWEREGKMERRTRTEKKKKKKKEKAITAAETIEGGKRGWS